MDDHDLLLSLFLIREQWFNSKHIAPVINIFCWCGLLSFLFYLRLQVSLLKFHFDVKQRWGYMNLTGNNAAEINIQRPSGLENKMEKLWLRFLTRPVGIFSSSCLQ